VTGLERPVATWPSRTVRDFVQVGGVRPLLRRAVSLEVSGLDDLAEAEGPVVIAANHSSHLDTPVLLATLPRARRRRTAVLVAPGYFPSRSRRLGAAVAFSAVVAPVAGDPARPDPDLAVALLRRGGTVVVYPERTRSADGYLGTFGPGAAELAMQVGVPVVPAALRGTYAAMPRGRSWPLRGRTRVSVRYGGALAPQPEETAAAFTARIEAAVRALLAEDTATWWAAQRGDLAVPEPPPGSWRRIWEQTQPPSSTGRPPRVRVWRD